MVDCFFFSFLSFYFWLRRPGGIPARNAKGERLLVFLGIIDILQSYRLKKKLEHTLKAMIHDGVYFSLTSLLVDSNNHSFLTNFLSLKDTVSVHRPGFYSQRFQNFMAKQVFRKVPSRKSNLSY